MPPTTGGEGILFCSRSTGCPS